MILKASLKHGGYEAYQFRIHKNKMSDLCVGKFDGLKRYLQDVMVDCPHQYFLEGPRSSVLKFRLPVELKNVTNHVEILARIGLESNYYNNAHMNVQMFMLAYDSKTIAIETPLWLLPEEYESFKKIFDSEKPLSGHIDILSIEDGKIWVWDYKPNAHREKYAATQVYFYALMLSKRTGIPLENFMCGYFDDRNTYIFDPDSVNV